MTRSERILPTTMLGRSALVVACAVAVLAASARGAAQVDALFEFHSTPG